jgi:hypothetical protein
MLPVAVVFSVLWYNVLSSPPGMHKLVFLVCGTWGLVGAFLLVVLPNTMALYRGRHPHLLSLVISGVSWLAMAAELAILLYQGRQPG